MDGPTTKPSLPTLGTCTFLLPDYIMYLSPAQPSPAQPSPA